MNTPMKLSTLVLAGLAVLTVPPRALASPITLPLNPGDMLAQTHSRAMMIATTGTFRSLSGTLRYDPATGACAVDVTFVVRSLQLPNALLRSKTMADNFLDPAEYPLEHYVATCAGATLTGALTMRGQTHPFNMTVTFDRSGPTPTVMHTAGTLNRFGLGREWFPHARRQNDPDNQRYFIERATAGE